MTDKQEVATQTPAPPTLKPKRLNPKQKKTIEYWFDSESETFGNLTKSAIKAGFRPKYALNLASNKPKWLYETVESTLKLEREHIIQGVQNIALKTDIESRSPDDTRLSAYELLGDWSGLNPKTGSVTVVNVQPILGGESVKAERKHVDNEQT